MFYSSIPCVIPYYPWIVTLLNCWHFDLSLVDQMNGAPGCSCIWPTIILSPFTLLTVPVSHLGNILSTFLCWDFFRSPLSVEMSYIELCFCPGQGFQVQAYPHWEQDSSLGPLLQDQKTFASKLEIVCQYFIAIIIFFKIARYSFLGSVKPINK